MKIGFVVNDFAREALNYTTTHLAHAAAVRGHEVRYVPVDGFSLGTDGRLAGFGLRLPSRANRSAKAVLDALGSQCPERLPLDDLDVLMLRNDPAEEFPARPWARLAAINFARFAAEAGVLVLNDPDGLMRHVNKLSLEHLPPGVRPRSVVTRDPGEVAAFAEAEGGPIVIKPLAGSGGRNVFLLRPEDRPNRTQMIEAILREGYVLAQEALPEAAEGDNRVFLLEGQVLEVDGEAAILRRRPHGANMRSNLAAGGSAERSGAGPSRGASPR